LAFKKRYCNVANDFNCASGSVLAWWDWNITDVATQQEMGIWTKRRNESCQSHFVDSADLVTYWQALSCAKKTILEVIL
jgi:hypothetical protein